MLNMKPRKQDSELKPRRKRRPGTHNMKQKKQELENRKKQSTLSTKPRKPAPDYRKPTRTLCTRLRKQNRKQWKNKQGSMNWRVCARHVTPGSIGTLGNVQFSTPNYDWMKIEN